MVAAAATVGAAALGYMVGTVINSSIESLLGKPIGVVAFDFLHPEANNMITKSSHTPCK